MSIKLGFIDNIINGPSTSMVPKSERDLMDFGELDISMNSQGFPALHTALPREISNKKPEKLEPEHGTTTLGFVFQGGVIISVDSRATQGSYVGSGEVKKVIEMNDWLLGTMAGGAADCAFWERVLAQECRMFELRNGRRPTVAAAASMLSSMLARYRGHDLSLGTMIAGWDSTGPNIQYVDNEGSKVAGTLFSVGSGSPFAYGVLDIWYRHDMTNDEAYDLARHAIYRAGHRDAMSGNTCRVYHITKEGWKLISHDDIMDLHERFKNRPTPLPRL